MTGSLEYYKVFYYTAKCGSVTKAAAELNISQPAVSQALKQLEQSLNTELFYRASKGMQLTAEGELLFSYVKNGYEQIEMGVQKVRQMQNMELGEIRIGASDMTRSFMSSILPLKCTLPMRLHPERWKVFRRIGLILQW